MFDRPAEAIFGKPIEDVMAHPRTDAERAFTNGYKSTSEGVTPHPGFSNPRHVNHRHFLMGVRTAETKNEV